MVIVDMCAAVKEGTRAASRSLVRERERVAALAKPQLITELKRCRQLGAAESRDSQFRRYQ